MHPTEKFLWCVYIHNHVYFLKAYLLVLNEKVQKTDLNIQLVRAH